MSDPLSEVARGAEPQMRRMGGNFALTDSGLTKQIGHGHPSRETLITLLSGEELVRLEEIGAGLTRGERLRLSREIHPVRNIRHERRKSA